nr:CoA ester lyase [Streptomyces sp. SID8352]
MSTPGDSESMIRKAAASQADQVFLDLEDAVADTSKDEARQRATWALANLDWKPGTRSIRMNAVTSPFGYQDVIDVVTGAGSSLDTIVVPKVTTARDVWWVATLLEQVEAVAGIDRQIGLEVLIEEPAAVLNAHEIATSSRRVRSLMFGPADLTAAIGATVDAIDGWLPRHPGDFYHHTRSQIALAAAAAKVAAVDGPYGAFRDGEGYRALCAMVADLGYQGKWAIHPSQIEIANEVFSPQEAELAFARRVVEAYRQAAGAGHGAATLDGALIDAADVRRAKSVLERARAIGVPTP